MTTSEREMIRPLTNPAQPPEEKFTSLQPTYEDTVQPDADEWETNELP